MHCANLQIPKLVIITFHDLLLYSKRYFLFFLLFNDNNVSLQMFVFGTKALEKFVDRLIEWPQYCQHILQISHLRATHSELVAFIERALARISSGHLDSDAGHNPASDQHHNSIPQPNIEVCVLHLISPVIFQLLVIKDQIYRFVF